MCVQFRVCVVRLTICDSGFVFCGSIVEFVLHGLAFCFMEKGVVWVLCSSFRAYSDGFALLFCCCMLIIGTLSGVRGRG